MSLFNRQNTDIYQKYEQLQPSNGKQRQIFEFYTWKNYPIDELTPYIDELTLKVLYS